jgi:AcrR family transcriptional regulator
MAQKTQNSTRMQLLSASLKAFGNKDYDAVSTREIVELAGANISAISYHFGGKKQLYLETAVYLAETLKQKMAPAIEQIEPPQDEQNPANCRQRIEQQIGAMVELVIVGELSADAAGFIFREQLKPTEAFDILYQELMQPMQQRYARLLACIFGCSEEEPQVKLITHSLLGQIMIFRLGETTILRRLNLEQFNQADCTRITRLISRQTMAAIDAHLQQEFIDA